MKKINVLSKFKKFDSHWSPHSIAELNGQQVIIAKIKGNFVWHSHKEEDELFYVIKDRLIGKHNYEKRGKLLRFYLKHKFHIKKWF